MAGRQQKDQDAGVKIGPDGKPWHGAVCRLCDSPVNYAWAKRAPMPGICGRCHDKLRGHTVGDAADRTRAAREAVHQVEGVKPGLGFGGGLLLLVLGAALGFAGAVATAIFAEDTFHEIINRAAALLGG
jgi:hypothetical protein